STSSKNNRIREALATRFRDGNEYLWRSGQCTVAQCLVWLLLRARVPWSYSSHMPMKRVFVAFSLLLLIVPFLPAQQAPAKNAGQSIPANDLPLQPSAPAPAQAGAVQSPVPP